MNGTAYFMVGNFCTQLYAFGAPNAATLLASGFDDASAVWATPAGIVVADTNGVYLVALP